MDVFIDQRFEDAYTRQPLVLVDVGARGGLKANWAAARRHLRTVGFEPDKREFDRLVSQAHASGDTTTFLNIAVHNRRGDIPIHIARDRGLTSIFEPDRAFLDAFPDAARFDTVDVQHIQADTLDNQLRANQIDDVDFVKADTQGSELLVLEGAKETLGRTAFGVEVEVEFTPIYRDQPLFADVDRFLRGLGFLLFDLRPCYWKRAEGRALGGPHGQIIWADALYLKSIAALTASIAPLAPELKKSKLLRALSISLLYGYYDYAAEIARAAGDLFTAEDRAAIARRLRQGGTQGPLSTLPGSRTLSAALRRLARWCRPHDKAWSVSDAEIGNLG